MNTPSVKRQRQRQRQWQGPFGMHCDAPKWVPDPFPSFMASVKTSRLPLPLPLGVFIPLDFPDLSSKKRNCPHQCKYQNMGNARNVKTRLR